MSVLTKETDLPVRVTPMVETRFGLDGGAMFGIVPKPLWSRTNPADEANRIAMTARCLLIEWEGGRRALVDVGLGGRWSQKERGIYAIEGQDEGLRKGLGAAGVEAGGVSDVILTHLHFDHAGGLGRQGAEGEMEAVYAGATHWVQRRNWSWAHAPSARDGGSYRLEDFACLEGAGAPRLELVDGVAEILPGVEVLPQQGHTFGMQVVKVTLESGTVVVFAADLIPTTSHLHDAYVMGYDLQPLVTVQEKRALVYEAMRRDWILAFSHDPECDFARVERDPKGRPRCVPIDSLDD